MRHNHQTISFLTLHSPSPSLPPVSLSLSFVFLLFAVCFWLFGVDFCANVNSFAGCTQRHKRMWLRHKLKLKLLLKLTLLPFIRSECLPMPSRMCVRVSVCVAGHLSFMWRNALPNCVQIAHTDNSFSLRHIKVFWLCCPGKLLRQHVLHFAASVTMTTTTTAKEDLNRSQRATGSNGSRAAMATGCQLSSLCP